jgi:hypothetical protein
VIAIDVFLRAVDCARINAGPCRAPLFPREQLQQNFSRYAVFCRCQRVDLLKSLFGHVLSFLSGGG